MDAILSDLLAEIDQLNQTGHSAEAENLRTLAIELGYGF